ncbi:MAG: hypothetical protein R3F43_08275 [bacterium]
MPRPSRRGLPRQLPSPTASAPGAARRPAWPSLLVYTLATCARRRDGRWLDEALSACAGG